MLLGASCLLVALVLSGCSRGPELVPVEGQVLFNGQPLEFGSVMFQPEAGQPARGVIQSDGTFELTTVRPGDGATVGKNRVRVTCFESQDPNISGGNGERPLGISLIPTKYNDVNTSGIEVEVRPRHAEPITLDLTNE